MKRPNVAGTKTSGIAYVYENRPDKKKKNRPERSTCDFFLRKRPVVVLLSLHKFI